MTKRLVAFSVAVLAAALSGAEEVARGLWKSFDYEKPDAKPIVFGGGDGFRAMKREAIDVMLDHRMNPDDISRQPFGLITLSIPQT